MATNPLSLLPSYSRIPSGFGFGWSRFWDLYEETFPFFESATVTKMLTLNSGDKIKVQIRMINGTDLSATVQDACRLLIRKI